MEFPKTCLYVVEITLVFECVCECVWNILLYHISLCTWGKTAQLQCFICLYVTLWNRYNFLTRFVQKVIVHFCHHSQSAAFFQLVNNTVKEKWEEEKGNYWLSSVMSAVSISASCHTSTECKPIINIRSHYVNMTVREVWITLFFVRGWGGGSGPRTRWNLKWHKIKATTMAPVNTLYMHQDMLRVWWK